MFHFEELDWPWVQFVADRERYELAFWRNLLWTLSYRCAARIYEAANEHSGIDFPKPIVLVSLDPQYVTTVARIETLRDFPVVNPGSIDRGTRMSRFSTSSRVVVNDKSGWRTTISPI